MEYLTAFEDLPRSQQGRGHRGLGSPDKAALLRSFGLEGLSEWSMASGVTSLAMMYQVKPYQAHIVLDKYRLTRWDDEIDNLGMQGTSGRTRQSRCTQISDSTAAERVFPPQRRTSALICNLQITQMARPRALNPELFPDPARCAVPILQSCIVIDPSFGRPFDLDISLAVRSDALLACSDALLL